MSKISHCVPLVKRAAYQGRPSGPEARLSKTDTFRIGRLFASLALGGLLAAASAHAQLAQTPLHMSVREFLAASFEGAKAKYVIGTGLDGELILSVPPAKLTPSQAFRVAVLAVDYPIERVVIDGIHVIRRKSGQNALPEPKKPVPNPTPAPLKKAKK